MFHIIMLYGLIEQTYEKQDVAVERFSYITFFLLMNEVCIIDKTLPK